MIETFEFSVKSAIDVSGFTYLNNTLLETEEFLCLPEYRISYNLDTAEFVFGTNNVVLNEAVSELCSNILTDKDMTPTQFMSYLGY